MNQPRFCGQCGAANEPTSNFCSSCGARLQAPPAQPTGPAAAPPAYQGGAPVPQSPYQGGASTPQPPYQGSAPTQQPPYQGGAPMPAAAPMPAQQATFATPAGLEKEPMLLLDVTGSMNYGTSANNPTPRRDTIHEAIGIIVAALAEQDSQAAHEEGGGGLRTVIFSGGRAADIGDLNPSNLNQVWSQIQWGGGTRIMPGWNTLINTYMQEFGQEDPSRRPVLMALVITDGEADDTAQFAQAVAQASGGVYVALAIIGYGPEHDAALRAYQQIEQTNGNVKVIPFGSKTDPQVIAHGLLRMIE